MSVTWERTRPETCLSDLALDGLAGGVLEAARSDEARSHLHECAACRARLEAVQRERDLELPALHVERAGAKVTRLRRRRVLEGLGIALAAAIALFVVLVPRSDVTRTKGSASLGFYVRHGESVRRGGDGEIVAPEDALRFVYSLERDAYLTIVSLDAAGKVSVYHPAGAQSPLPPGREVALPNAALLDATLGREMIYGLFCDAPPDLERVKSQLGKREAPRSDDCSIVELSIEKRK